jgi:hypothetical protein
MPLNKEQLWQVMKAAALLDPGLRDNFLRALAGRLEGVSRPSNRELGGALRAALAQYGIAAGSGVLGEPRRRMARAERREQSARHPGV